MSLQVVAVGGGHGLAETLRGLVGAGHQPTAVVTVADDGGSSGRLRRDHGVIALGDLRMALDAMARRSDLGGLLGHRFRGGALDGHAFGNLLLLALVEQAGGDVLAALKRAEELLDSAGRVLPCTTVPVTLSARVDGRRLDGQALVTGARGHHREVWLEPPDAPACDAAVAAIAAADLVVLGPGSLWTSVIPNLLVPGIRDALAATAARIVHVGNLTTEPGETEGMDAQAHVDALLHHLPGARLAAVVLHDGGVRGGPGAPLGTDVRHPRVDRVVTADLARRDRHGHDPDRLAAILGQVVTKDLG